MLIASLVGDRPRQAIEGARLTRHLSQLAFMDGVKSLDLLQALIVHIGIYHVHLNSRSQISNLTQLALALLADLGYAKPSHQNDRRKLIFDESRTSFGFHRVDAPCDESLPAYRCALACFYLSSVYDWPLRSQAPELTLAVASP